MDVHPGLNCRAVRAALLYGEGMVLVESERPDELHGSQTGRGWVYVAVDDIDGHYQRAKAAGVEVLNEPHDAMDGTQRGYSARDLEGNLWSFRNRTAEAVADSRWSAVRGQAGRPRRR